VPAAFSIISNRGIALFVVTVIVKLTRCVSEQKFHIANEASTMGPLGTSERSRLAGKDATKSVYTRAPIEVNLPNYRPEL